jgi:hypothetical protein
VRRIQGHREGGGFLRSDSASSTVLLLQQKRHWLSACKGTDGDSDCGDIDNIDLEESVSSGAPGAGSDPRSHR